MELAPVGGTRITPLRLPTMLWTQAVLADPSAEANTTGVDLSDVRTVELVPTRGDGRVWIADVSAAPEALATVPVARAPRLDLGKVRRITEGDPAHGVKADTSSVELPFTISAPSLTPTRFAVSVVAYGLAASGASRTIVTVPPGTTAGVIPVEYTRDRRDDYLVEDLVTAYPLSGLAVGESTAAVRVGDDDPLPTFHIFTPTPNVTEGEDAVFRIVATGGRDYELFAAPVVHQTPPGKRSAHGRDLNGFDVPADWLRPRAFVKDRSVPLWQSEMHFGAELGPRREVLDFRIPIRDDGLREGTETLTVVVMIRHLDIQCTVRVHDPA